MKNFTLMITMLLATSFAFAQKDMGVSKVVTPPDGSILEDGMDYTVTVRVKNYGSVPIDTIDVTFNVGTGNSAVNESLTSAGLAVGDSIDITFTNQWTVTDIGSGFGLTTTTNDDDDLLNNGVTTQYTMTPAGIAQQQNQQKVVLQGLYPNPSSETLNFILWGTEEITVKLIAMDGKIVRTELFQLKGGENQLYLPVHDLPRGNYVFSAEFGNGSIERKFQITE